MALSYLYNLCAELIHIDLKLLKATFKLIAVSAGEQKPSKADCLSMAASVYEAEVAGVDAYPTGGVENR